MTDYEDQPASMWTYWRDKKGVEEALSYYFFRTLMNDSELNAAYLRFKLAEKQIDDIMARRQKGEPA